ncbi:MAG: hypothetical protein ABI321_09440 [Polyangia bacterium]
MAGARVVRMMLRAGDGDGKPAGGTGPSKVSTASTDAQTVKGYLDGLNARVNKRDIEAYYELYLWNNYARGVRDSETTRAEFDATFGASFKVQTHRLGLVDELKEAYEKHPERAKSIVAQLHKASPDECDEKWVAARNGEIDKLVRRDDLLKGVRANWSRAPEVARADLLSLGRLVPQMAAWTRQQLLRLGVDEKRVHLQGQLSAHFYKRPGDAQNEVMALYTLAQRSGDATLRRTFSAAWMRKVKDSIWKFQDAAWAQKITGADIQNWLGDNAVEYEDAPVEVKQAISVDLGRQLAQLRYGKGGQGAKDTRTLDAPNEDQRQTFLSKTAKAAPANSGFTWGDKTRTQIERTDKTAKRLYDDAEREDRDKELEAVPGTPEYESMKRDVVAKREQAGQLLAEAQRRKSDKSFNETTYVAGLEQQSQQAKKELEDARVALEARQADFAKKQKDANDANVGVDHRIPQSILLTTETSYTKTEREEFEYRTIRATQLQSVIESERSGIAVPVSVVLPQAREDLKVKQAFWSGAAGIKPGTAAGDAVNASEWAVAAGATSAYSMLVRAFAGIVDYSVVGLADWGAHSLTNAMGLTSGPGAMETVTNRVRVHATSAEEVSAAEMRMSGNGLLPSFVKGATEALVLYLPTMGFGAAGAALGEAVGLGEMAGASVGLGTFGFLSTSGKGWQERLQSTLMFAAMPLVGSRISTLSTPARVAAAFTAGALPVMMFNPAWLEAPAIAMKDGPAKAVDYVLSKIDWSEVASQGLLFVFMQEYDAAKTRNQKVASADKFNLESQEPLIRGTQEVNGVREEQYARVRKGADGQLELVAVPKGEVAKYARFGKGLELGLTDLRSSLSLRGEELGAKLDPLLRPQREQLALDATGQGLERSIEGLEKDRSRTPQQIAEERTRLEGEVAKVNARKQVVAKVAAQEPIDAGLVHTIGDRPRGYVPDGEPARTYRYDRGLDEAELGLKEARTQATQGQAVNNLSIRARIARAREALRKANRRGKAEEVNAARREVSEAEDGTKGEQRGVESEKVVVEALAKVDTELARLGLGRQQLAVTAPTAVKVPSVPGDGLNVPKTVEVAPDVNAEVDTKALFDESLLDKKGGAEKAHDFAQRLEVLERLSPAEAAKLREAYASSKAWLEVEEKAWRGVPKELRGQVMEALEDRAPLTTKTNATLDPNAPSVLDAKREALRLDGDDVDGLQFVKQKGGADATDGMLLRDAKSGKEYFFKPDDVSPDTAFEQQTGQKMGMRERRAAASELLFSSARVDTPKVRLVEIKLGADGKPNPKGTARRGTLQEWRTDTVDLKNFQGGPEAEAALLGTNAKSDIDVMDYVVQHSDRVQNDANYLVSLDGKSITPVDNDMTFGLKTSSGVESPRPTEITSRLRTELERVLAERATLEPELVKLLTPDEISRTFARIEEVVKLDVRGATTKEPSPVAAKTVKPGTSEVTPTAVTSDDAIIKQIAIEGERWTNNKLEGTCATAAMKNTISAQIAGYEAYVIEFDGWNKASPWIQKLGLDPDGALGRIFAKLGVATKDVASAHAVAAVKGADGNWRYLSWGRVEADWEVFAKEAFDGYSMRGTFNTGDHVRWMVDHKWEYKHPTTGKLVERALIGWMIDIGK